MKFIANGCSNFVHAAVSNHSCAFCGCSIINEERVGRRDRFSVITKSLFQYSLFTHNNKFTNSSQIMTSVTENCS